MGNGASKSKHKSSPILSNSNKVERERRHHFNNLVNNHETNIEDNHKKNRERQLRKDEGYNWNRSYNVGLQNDFFTSSSETRKQNAKDPTKLKKCESSHQVAVGPNRSTAETMRHRTRNSGELSPHANKGKHIPRRASGHNNTENSSYEYLLSNWNDPQSEKYAMSGTLSRVGPPAASINRMTKSQHHFQRQSTLPTKSHRKYKWDVPSDYTIIHPPPSLVGPRVLPLEVPDAKEHFRMNSLRRNVNRASASYGNFDSFYPTQIHYGKEDQAGVANHMESFLPSRKDISNSFLDSKSKKPSFSNTIHRSQFSFENKDRETNVANNFEEDICETNLRKKKTRRSHKLSRQDDVFNDDSASDYSENDRQKETRDESLANSQAFTEDDNQNFYSNVYNKTKVKTIDRTKKKRTKHETSRSKPVGSSREESPVLVSSLGPSDALWKNSPEMWASQDDFPPPPSPIQHRIIERNLPQYHNAGTTRRKSKHRSSTLSRMTGNEPFDDVMEPNIDQRSKGLEYARDFTYQPSFTLESSRRRSKRRKAKETRSATDFSDLYKTLPSKFDSLFNSSTVDEQSTMKRTKKKKKRHSSVRQDSANHAAEELEKLIETQLAGALSSIMTHQ